MFSPQIRRCSEKHLDINPDFRETQANYHSEISTCKKLCSPEIVLHLDSIPYLEHISRKIEKMEIIKSRKDVTSPGKVYTCKRRVVDKVS
ncbi:hypothetical protein M8J76_013326 [Diaphorina citri]|nr:hypothetical protein M8J76_013326 [Diaphorina citri]